MEALSGVVSKILADQILGMAWCQSENTAPETGLPYAYNQENVFPDKG
jgi:hypothetical protein